MRGVSGLAVADTPLETRLTRDAEEPIDLLTADHNAVRRRHGPIIAVIALVERK